MYTSNVIQAAIEKGFRPALVSGKRIVRLYICHACKKKTMFKAYGKDRNFNACMCGYRKEF